jgi:hypothetical protein
MKRLSILLSFVIITIFITGAFIYAYDGGQSKDKGFELAKVTGSPRSTLLNVNNLAAWFRADGWSARDPRTGNSGVFFPRGLGTSAAVIFQDGIIWGGLVKDGQSPVLRVGGQTYNIGTVEGRIVSKGQAEDPNAADVRIYRVRKNFAIADLTLDADELGLTVDQVRAQYAKDWQEWPWQKGAPWTGVGDLLDSGYLGPDGVTIVGAGNGVLDRGEDANSNSILDPGEDANGNGKLDGETPGIAGADAVVWTVANDLSLGAVQGLYGSPPIGIEMQLTAWGYRQTGALGNMIFKQVKLIYKGTDVTPANATVDSMYVVQWSDPDLGTYSDDFVGVDTTLSLAFVYNSTSIDPTYNGLGLVPPASGYDFFQGVLVPGDPGDEAIFNLQKITGFKNLPMSSFGYFAAGSPITDPGPLGSYQGTIEWWNLLRGFTPQSDPQNPVRFTLNDGVTPTLFPLAGDPVTGTGDIDGVILPPGDRRLLMVTGPFTFTLGDTQEVVISLIAALGSDRLSSVAVLKFFDRTAQATFDNLFQVPKPPPTPNAKAIGLDREIVLNWGFDPDAVAATEGQDEFGFKFEGYNVYQLKTPSPDLSAKNAIKLATFDLVNEITTILSEGFDINTGVIIEQPVQVGKNTGLKRFFRVTKDAFRDRPIANDQDYYFSVTAYNATEDPLQTTKALESPPVVLAVRAQKAPPGVRYQSAFGDTVEVSHPVGASDGSVVVRVVDPTQVTGDDYKVVFEQVTVGDETEIVWHLINVTKGDTVLKNQTKQITDPSDEEFFNVDGLFIQVFGAPNDFKEIAMVANANGPFDVPQIGFDWYRHAALYDPTQAKGGWFFWVAGGPTIDNYTDAVSRWTRGGVRFSRLVPNDYEMRWTDRGGKAWMAFTTGTLVDVPYELWFLGSGTIDDPSDDIRMMAWMFDDDGNDVFNFKLDHQASSGNNDPYSDWIYWLMPEENAAPGEAAYEAAVARSTPDYDGAFEIEHLARTVLMNWNTSSPGGASGGGNLEEMPESGSVFRITMTKPNFPTDEFTFSTSGVARQVSAQLKKEDALEMVGVFPNPYLGVNRLETSSRQRFVRFNHLPENVTIRIFNLAGTLVKTLNKNDTSQYLDWDLQNENSLPVASGVYIANVEMPGIGAKNLKLVVVQEQQFLKTF